MVDDDLGQSGSRSGQRFGFEEMVSRTALGQIGLILALEVARLARSNRDWDHLLDVCALTATLIADEEGLYDPASHMDRLLRGLKGTMSEAELYLIRQRLVEATRAKARRGELPRKLPPGYGWDEAGRMQKNPDAQVVGALARVFARFEQVGTIHQTHLYLLHEGVDVPVRTPDGKLLWRPPTYEQVRRLFVGRLSGANSPENRLRSSAFLRKGWAIGWGLVWLSPIKNRRRCWDARIRLERYSAANHRETQTPMSRRPSHLQPSQEQRRTRVPIRCPRACIGSRCEPPHTLSDHSARTCATVSQTTLPQHARLY